MDETAHEAIEHGGIMSTFFVWRIGILGEYVLFNDRSHA
jgi:hypothetical protein